jgi:hypothetical protein
MKKADLYMLHVRSANVRAAADDFAAEQRRITGGVKKSIRKTLAKGGLSSEFAYAEGRVSGIARCFQVYATPQAIAAVCELPGVERAERMTVSAYSLTRNL